MSMSEGTSKILVTGATGMLGSYIDFGVRFSKSELDVRNLDEVRRVFNEIEPEVVLHLAASTDYGASQASPENTYLTNAVGTYNIALAAKDFGSRVVLVSTSAVFNGTKHDSYTEDDVPKPISHYGHSKYLGELALQGLLSNFAIVRACWLFGGGPNKDHKFVAGVIRQLEQPIIHVVSDRRGSPTYCKDLASELKKILYRSSENLYHLSNSGNPTRAEIAREIVRLTGSKAKVVEVEAEAFETRYPGTSSRGNESMHSNFVSMRSWQEALEDYIKHEWQGNK